ncbi:MAG: discoidin domain-containing protein, partial [Eubacterium sp.]|nr:discoidin domain-containing protein [Eubacterium sp.]
MKLSKTMKKFMAVVCTFALVVSSLAVNNFVKADDGSWAFTSTSYQTNAEKTQYNITVNYSAYQGAEPDGYYYSIYVDEEADGNIGIASNGWDWGKAQGRHGFDTVYKAKDGEAFKPGETHKIIVVAYQKNEDESFTRLDSIETEITLPAELPTLSQEEQEKKDMEDACVSDENLAKGTTGFVSWNEDPAPALVDGNLGTGTGNSSVKGENDFIGVNLGEVKTIGSIITKFESACPAEFAVYVAGADGVYDDTPVATNTAEGVNPIVKTTFTAVEAQYVKVVQTVPSGLSTAYGMNAFELAVFAGEKTPENPETTPAEVDTTTPAEVDTTTPEVVETTTPEVVETTKEDEPGYDPGFNPAELTYQDMACDGGETIGFALQESTIAGVVPYYENSGNTFSVMFSGDAGMVTAVTVNGQEPDEGVVIEKATGVVRINPTNFADNAYTVVTATAENGEMTFVIKKGTPAVEEPDTTTAEPDTTTVEPDTTTAEPDTTTVEQDTTKAPVEMTFEEVAGTGAEIVKGNFTLWINESNTMAIAVDPEDANHIQGKIVSNNGNWDQWGAVQYKIIKTGLKAGEEYTISVDLKASDTDGVIVTDGDVASVDFAQSTEATLTRKVAADENGAIVLTVGAGQVGIGVVLDFSNVVVKDSEGNIVEDKPEEPETTTPADVETTTPADAETTTKTPATTEVPKTTT